MRVLLAGATGAIGSRLIPLLREAGHDVWGLTRRASGAARIEAQGARALLGDALDPTSVTHAFAESRPDAVIHQLTDLPQAVTPRHLRKGFTGNDKLRRDGTRNLVAAATQHRATRLVMQGSAFWYAPGAGLADEDTPLATVHGGPTATSIHAMLDAERTALDAPSLRTTVLRYGTFYGPGTWYAADGAVAKAMRARQNPIIGRGDGVTSFVHIDDAARATLAALETDAPGIYNIVDDDPAPQHAWAPAFAEAVGAPPPAHVPRLIARLLLGRASTAWLVASRGATNRRAKTRLGWAPEFPSWREGFQHGLA